MGNAVSLARHAFAELLNDVRTFQALKTRIEAEPGLPVKNPTHVVVVGSGITGTSVARTLLDRAHSEGQRPAVLMLEAREACSGATGRNGGHISPALYKDYADLREDHGDDAAQKMIKFRLAHLHEIRRAAEEEGVLEESQWREVETVDAFYNQALFEKAKAKVHGYQQALSFEASHHRVYESAEAIQKYHLASDVAGCIASGAGALHPYNFVTGILSKLLGRYPDNFLLCTRTPCTSITGPTTSDPLYTVVTPKGSVKTSHVIHATNGWSSQLLKPMRGRIIPFRGNMTAQRPGQSIPAETLQRSFVFYEVPVGYDYLTELPNGEREFMFGGGFAQQSNEEIANTDDSKYNKRVGAHLGGVLPRYFGEDNWGREGHPPEGDTSEWSKGRVKANWSGILGISADMLPWVGRLSPSMSGRPAPSSEGLPSKRPEDKAFISAAPGEWIAAGYSGEGMVHAWMSGKALAEMVLGREKEGNHAEWFPEILWASTKRWKQATPESLLDGVGRD